MRTKVIGALALAAIAGSANAAIVTGPGVGSDAATFEGSTSTTITYSGFTEGSWAGELFEFRIKAVLYRNSGNGHYAPIEITQIPIGLIEYSSDAGGLWNVYSTSSTSANTLSTNALAFAFSPAITHPSGLFVGQGNFLFRITIPASSLLVNGQTFRADLQLRWANSLEVNTRSSQVVPVPTPGAAALLGLGGLLAARRRR